MSAWCAWTAGEDAVRNIGTGLKLYALAPAGFDPRRTIQNHFYHRTAPPGAEWACDRLFNAAEIIPPKTWWNVSLRYEYSAADIEPGDYLSPYLSFHHYENSTYRWEYKQISPFYTSDGTQLAAESPCRADILMLVRTNLATGEREFRPMKNCEPWD